MCFTDQKLRSSRLGFEEFEMIQSVSAIVDLEQHPLSNKKFRTECKLMLNKNGALFL
jgi:hypothetical protein